jgi:threonine dehydratase
MGGKEGDLTAIDVLRARRALQGSAIRRTPLTQSRGLSDATGAEIHLKWENLQVTGAYKPRGAFYRMSLLTPEERARGVITASAGNWALGVAMAAQMMGVRSTICVPANTPKVKVDRCRAFGAEVVLHGSYFDEAFAHCQELSRSRGATYVSGTDDYDVFAGHGTVGVEILEDLPDVESIVIPVGGGGLASGVACWAKTLNPAIKIVGAQSTAAHTMHECFRARRLVDVPVPPTIAEGLAGGITQLNLDLALRMFDDIVLADEEDLLRTIRWVLASERQVIEGSAAVGPAALLQKKVKLQHGQKVAVVISGGNIDSDMLGVAGL